jgi:hypothetical protein
MLETKLVGALVALGASIWLWYWRRRSRREWAEYDAEFHGDERPLRPSRAADRARFDDPDR